MNRDEIQLMLNEERVKILASLDRALANQDRIKNIHIDLGRGVMSYIKEPPVGAAEIEPKPQGGRRWENRVRELDEQVANLQLGINELECTRVAQLEQQVQALEKRVEANFLVTRSLVEDADVPTPPQSADDAEKWEAVAKASCYAYRQEGRARSHGDQWASADDAWRSVGADEQRRMKVEVKAAVAKATELGLVPRIDPEDEAQLRVVAEAVESCLRGQGFASWNDYAKAALTALAGHLNGPHND